MGPNYHAVSSRVYIQSVLRCMPPSRNGSMSSNVQADLSF